MKNAIFSQKLAKEAFLPFMIIFLLLFSTCFVAFSAENVKFVQELNSNLIDPVDVAISDAGEMYVLDRKGAKVVVFDPEGSFLYEFGEYGSAAGKMNQPHSLVISNKGDVVVADTGNSRVQVFTNKGRLIFEIGSDGNLPGQFHSPISVATDMMGYIYVADQGSKTISKFSPKGVFLEVEKLEHKPWDIVFDLQQNMYILYPELGKIVKRSADGVWLDDIEFNIEGRNHIFTTAAMTVDMRGDIYIIETKKHGVNKFDQEQNLLFAFGSKGIGRGQFDQPAGLTADQLGRIWIADSRNNRVQILEITGSQKSELIAAKVPPPMIDFDSAIPSEKAIVDLEWKTDHGLFALSDTKGHILHRDISNTNIYGEMEDRSLWLRDPKALHIFDDGKMLIADTGNNRLQFWHPDGSLDYFFGNKGEDNGQFQSLSGVAVNNEGYIYVSDTLNNRIQVFNSDGIYLNQFGDKSEDLKGEGPELGMFYHPTDLLFDSKGHLYVLDSRNNRVQVFDDELNFSRLIGGVDNKGVKLSQPIDISLDENDYLYIADRGDHSIKILDPNGDPVIQFGSAGKGPSYFPELSAVDAWDGKIYVADYRVDHVKVFDFYPDPEQAKLAKQKEMERLAQVKKEREDARAKAEAEAKELELVKQKEWEAQQAKEMEVESKVAAVDDAELIIVTEPKQMVKDIKPEKNMSIPFIKENISEAMSVPVEVSVVEVVPVAEPVEQRIYFTQVSFPLHTDSSNEAMKKSITRKMTLKLATSNVAAKFGMPEDHVAKYIKIEKEEILEDGKLKMTISVPKVIPSEDNVSLNSGSDILSQLK